MDILISTNKAFIDKFGGDIKSRVGKYMIAVKEPTNYIHYFYIERKDCLCFYFGNQYEQNDNDAFLSKLYDNIKLKKYNEIMKLDGEFVCGLINWQDNTLELLTDREGIIPLYYKKNDEGWSVTTEQAILFENYKESEINYCAVNDFLRFGTLIGAETFSTQVFRSRGGSVMNFYTNGTCHKNRIYKFHYDEKHSNQDINLLIQEVAKAYRNAIVKRVKGKEKTTCIFMSGGMDSRYLLAVANQCLEEKLYTYCFGQEYSEEVNVARMCADVDKNPFEWIMIQPEDFVSHAEEYERIVCGSDMFPQSYIIKAAKNIKETHFITGYALDAYMGGTFLSEEAISYEGRLDEFIKDHLSLIKMNVFSKNELIELCINEEIGNIIFGRDTQNLEEDAKQYSELLVADAIQAFANDNRAKNLVLQRELTPAKYMDCSYVSCDKDFLEVISKIPARLRLNHKFYHELYKATATEYAKIAYNNTTLPVLAPVEVWEEAIDNEAKRERQYEKIMEEYNNKHDNKMYYPHYYSDFNGYSRYDNDWKTLFEKYLFADDAFVTHKVFDMEKVKSFYEEHLSGKKNRRKELVYLTSLEVFFKTMLKY